jgi:hypothetical protein
MKIAPWFGVWFSGIDQTLPHDGKEPNKNNKSHADIRGEISVHAKTA